MQFVDSHCHLDLLEEDLTSVIARAADAGVSRLVIPGIDLKSSQRVIEIAEKYPGVYAAVGIHPHEVEKTGTNDIAVLAKLAAHPKVVAIGEIGLDYHFPPFNMERQKQVLRSMFALANESGKPVILHSRDALPDLAALLQEEKIRPAGVFHMFEGDSGSAKQVLGMGFFIGVGGSVTFKNNARVAEILAQLGTSRVVLETDAPYISPHPFRGTINEPSRIPLIAKKIAEILETQVELIAEQTTKNAILLFSLD